MKNCMLLEDEVLSVNIYCLYNIRRVLGPQNFNKHGQEHLCGQVLMSKLNILFSISCNMLRSAMMTFLGDDIL